MAYVDRSYPKLIVIFAFCICVPGSFAQMQMQMDYDEFHNWSNNHPYQSIDSYKGNPKNLEKYAEKGDADAAFELGWGFLTRDWRKSKGGSDAADADAAFRWLHKAADLGYNNGSGEASVAEWYWRGLGVTKSDTETLFWLNRAVTHGSPSAPRMLAKYQASNGGSPSSDPMALYREAAKRGDVQAGITLGLKYLRGDGVPKDKAAADSWFKIVDQSADPATEQKLGQAYLSAGDTPDALAYFTKSALEPAQFSPYAGFRVSQTQQESLQLMANIYQQGTGIPADQAAAQRCLAARQALIDEQSDEQAALNDQIARGHAEQMAQQRAQLVGAIGDLGRATTGGSPIQQTTSQQLANIQAAQARAQQAQVSKPIQAASAQPPKYNGVTQAPATVANSGTAPLPTCVDLGPGNCMPIAQYQQLQAQKNQQGVVLNTLCPASGFVPGVMTHPAPDVALGVQCKPGSAIYINGVPQFDTTGTGLGPVTRTGAGSGANGSGNGGGSINSSDGPPEAGCIQLSSDPTNTYPVFHNTCTFAVKYFWTPFTTPPGGYAEQNGILQPGETQTGAETAVGGYRIYACQTNYNVVGPDGTPITGVVNGYRCVKQ